jgi:kinesin family member 1
LLSFFVIVSGFVTKAGPVAIWEHTEKEWIRKFLVLRRPYLYLYSSPSELDDEAAMSVFTLRLDHGERVSDMFRVRFLFGTTNFEVPHVFAIYTSFNSFLVQARSLEDMQDWIMKIDRNYSTERTKSL